MKTSVQLSTFLLAIGLLVACNGGQRATTERSSTANSSQSNATQTTSPEPMELPSNPPPAGFIKFIKHPIIDEHGTRMVASTYLMPADWGVQEQLWWDFNDPSLPVRYRAQLGNADSSLGYEVFPTVRIAYSQGGATQGYPPPQSLTQGIEQYLSTLRPHLRFRVEARHDNRPQVGALQQSYGSQSQTQHQDGWLRISYQLHGQTIEEELTGSLDQSRTDVAGAMYNMMSIIWQLDVSSVKAVKGKLDLARRIGAVVRNSTRPELPWFNQVLSISAMLRDGVMRERLRQQQDFNAIMQNRREISAMHQAAYQERIKQTEKQNEQFGDLMGGINRYVDPYQNREVQIPSVYENVWVSRKGEYLMSETAGFNPNDYTQLASEDWKKIEKKAY